MLRECDQLRPYAAAPSRPRQRLDLPLQPPVAVFLVEDAEDHDARGRDPIVDSIIADLQAIERWRESGEAFDPRLDLTSGVSAEARANFLQNEAGDGMREFGDLSSCVSRDLDGESG